MKNVGRREWADAGLTGILYFVAAVVALSFTRFEGGGACLWMAGAVVLAKLSVIPRRRWGPVLIACGIANYAASAYAGVGPLVGLPVSLISMSESAGAALLLRWLRRRKGADNAVADLLSLILAAGLLTPAVASVPAGLLIAWATETSFAHNWWAWFSGHALGAMTFTPVLTLIFSGEARRWIQVASRTQLLEIVALLSLVGMVAVLVFAQDDHPLLFLPVLPVMLATFVGGRFGAAASVVVVALIGGAFTAAGSGPIGSEAVGPSVKILFFQFYLAATVLTALPAAAELRRQRVLFERLRDSEARYRLLADNSSDLVLNVEPDGVIVYASPSAVRLGGFAPDELIGRVAIDLVHPKDRGIVLRAHRQVMDDPAGIVSAEYRVPTAWGEDRWFESRTRAVRDEDGNVTGQVSAMRDVTDRKAVEVELAHAASTDPLTGLPNRRVFDAALERLLASGGPGCVAIFDLDHFKAVNDRFGHEGGDRVLTSFAATARSVLRDGDLVARLGGEEFGVLLPGAGREQARAVCERLRLATSAEPVPLAGGPARVTASAGLAEVRSGATAAGLLRAADEALYRAKTSGRDRLNLAA